MAGGVMENIGTYLEGFMKAQGLLNPACQVDELELSGGLQGSDGVVVERVLLDGLELETIEFPVAA